MTHLGLVDLVALVLVGSSVVGALVARRGLLPALLSGAGTAVFCWLVCLGLVAWAPGTLARAASSSALLELVPVPRPALEQARALGGWLAGQLGTWH
ncbi:hypothetical protein [Microlunatus flavus]|uniref:Uncharacterized protein n=1 Tax=Microlunatus flavus TaxID=1036181 RepID=A0A1H9IG20_9ACTN|nr:hypothetical protein [Microlunatus flavus]SEQ73516.1 hypothetical protein SAMN05421756_105235 [Microlunatus flavus]